MPFVKSERQRIAGGTQEMLVVRFQCLQGAHGGRDFDSQIRRFRRVAYSTKLDKLHQSITAGRGDACPQPPCLQFRSSRASSNCCNFEPPASMPKNSGFAVCIAGEYEYVTSRSGP